MTDRSERGNHSTSSADGTRTNTKTGADRVREHRETLDALADSDLPAAWIAEALLEWIRTDGDPTPSRDD